MHLYIIEKELINSNSPYIPFYTDQRSGYSALNTSPKVYVSSHTKDKFIVSRFLLQVSNDVNGVAKTSVHLHIGCNYCSSILCKGTKPRPIRWYILPILILVVCFVDVCIGIIIIIVTITIFLYINHFICDKHRLH